MALLLLVLTVLAVVAAATTAALLRHDAPGTHEAPTSHDDWSAGLPSYAPRTLIR